MLTGEMMELTKHLSPEQILLSVDVKDKWELLDLMIKAVLKHPICKSQSPETLQQIKANIVKREKDMSTGMGGGYALPHARVRGFKGFAVCIARLKNDIDYESIDGQPIKLICMVIAPEENPTIVLKVLGTLSRFLLNEADSHVFYNENDPIKLYEYLREKEIDLDVSIVAKDIMITSFSTVETSTPLQMVVDIMHNNRIQTVAVTDHNGMLSGEITCDLLFKKGMPDFFSQLMSVSFIKDFDPFEKYFRDEARSTADQVMSKDFASVNESATLMEIVYLLSVKKHSTVFVTRDGKLCGTINRITVLDNILNF